MLLSSIVALSHDLGISRASLYRASKVLGILSSVKVVNKRKEAMWRLPESPPQQRLITPSSHKPNRVLSRPPKHPSSLKRPPLRPSGETLPPSLVELFKHNPHVLRNLRERNS